MKTWIKTVIFSFLLTTISIQAAKGQYYDIGQEPASTNWSTIETSDFKFIFPDNLKKIATETAFYFQHSATNVQSGLKVRPLKTPILLHPNFAYSNAYAVWAPQRIEVLTTPPQDSYGHPWLNQLALHEYRHIVQLSKLNQGLTHGLTYLFGQQAIAVSTGLFVPSWFLEGDAVVTETEFSKTGRGRVPAFSVTLRAQLAERGAYSYPKAAFGSYRDYVPDIYTLGYHIVAFGREKYGMELWNSAMNSVARKPYTFTPFNLGLKKISGLNKKGLYNKTVTDLDSIWGGKQDGDALYIKSQRQKGEYINYLNPACINDSMVVSLKTSFNKTPKIVKISPSGREETILTPGYIIDNLITTHHGWMAWVEYRPHVRWQTVSYTDVVLYHPALGIVKRKSFKRKLYAPVAKADGTAFAAIEYNAEGTAFISIINESSEQKIKVPETIHPITPTWMDNENALIFIAIDPSGKRFMKLNTIDSTFTDIGKAEYTEISDPQVADEWLYFTGTIGDKSQVCRMNLETQLVETITESAYGAIRPSVNHKTLIYSDYTADGYRIAQKSLNKISSKPYYPTPPEDWIRVNKTAEPVPPYSESPSSDSGYISKKYQKGLHLFNIHSWAPLYVDVSGETARPGFSVMSQNLLSTMFLTAGFDYDLNEQTGMFKTKITYKGWFPTVSAEISSGNRAASHTVNGLAQRFTWHETNTDLSIGQSLDFSRGNFTRGIFGEATYTNSQISHNQDTPENYTRGTLSALSYRFFAYTYARQAIRDLAPPLGMNVDFRYRHSPYGSLDAGNILALQTQFFLPGLFANHSLGIYAGYQRSQPGKYRFQNLIGSSRGYQILAGGNEMISLKINYKLPLWYPDFNLMELVYLKRISLNIFQDFTQISAGIPAQNYPSTGLDIITDVHILGLSMPVSTGLRGIYLHKNKNTVFEFLFSINFYNY
ncbi:MAG: hypothetical protein RBS07_10135 [Lentimicrobium sp.]|nr:hypothetical protein [Lentimicrobium sp.]